MALAFIPPCVPKPTTHIPIGDAWEHEPKLDGFRLEVVKERRSVRLFSRRGADWTRRLHTLTHMLEALPSANAILDCELVYMGPTGAIVFTGLTFGSDQLKDGLNLFVFDLLHLNGRELIDRPLFVRRRLLMDLMAKNAVPRLHLVAGFEDGHTLFRAVQALELEGIVSKRRDAPYRSGPCSDWLKIKTPSWKEAHKERWRLFSRR